MGGRRVAVGRVTPFVLASRVAMSALTVSASIAAPRQATTTRARSAAPALPVRAKVTRNTASSQNYIQLMYFCQCKPLNARDGAYRSPFSGSLEPLPRTRSMPAGVASGCDTSVLQDSTPESSTSSVMEAHRSGGRACFLRLERGSALLCPLWPCGDRAPSIPTKYGRQQRLVCYRALSPLL